MVDDIKISCGRQKLSLHDNFLSAGNELKEFNEELKEIIKTSDDLQSKFCEK